MDARRPGGALPHPALPLPGIARRLPAGTFHLVLAGHLHAGQIVPPRTRAAGLRRSRIRAPTSSAGTYVTAGGPLHVSPGTGTTFVPFRFFARPEVTELVLRAPVRSAGAA